MPACLRWEGPDLRPLLMKLVMVEGRDNRLTVELALPAAVERGKQFYAE